MGGRDPGAVSRVTQLHMMLRDAAWLRPDRARAISQILLVAAAVCLALLLYAQLSRPGGGGDAPDVARDFASFWTAGRMALGGHAAEVYLPAAHLAAQQALYGAGIAGYAAFFYPPVFLPLCAALALLPFGVAAILWVVASLLAYAVALRRLLPLPGGVVAALAYPAVFINAGFAQNGFVSAALFGFAAVWLERRPVCAGICLGALAYKPQLGVLVPVALAAAGRFRAFAAAGAMVLLLVAVSAAVFGIDTWQSFLADASEARRWMQDGNVGFAKMTSAFAAVRLFGGSIVAAYAVQFVVALGAIITLVAIARRRPGGAAEISATAAATLLATPFSLHYDFVVLAVPLAWLLTQASRTAWRPWEKTVLAAVWLWPIVALLAAIAADIPLAPLAPAALLLLMLRRVVENRRTVR
jgi:hypothetical protein